MCLLTHQRSSVKGQWRLTVVKTLLLFLTGIPVILLSNRAPWGWMYCIYFLHPQHDIKWEENHGRGNDSCSLCVLFLKWRSSWKVQYPPNGAWSLVMEEQSWNLGVCSSSLKSNSLQTWSIYPSHKNQFQYSPVYPQSSLMAIIWSILPNL